jgi:hypothetical protein
MPRPSKFYHAMLQARKQLAGLSKEQRAMLAMLRKAARDGQPALVILPFSGLGGEVPKAPKPPKEPPKPKPELPKTWQEAKSLGMRACTWPVPDRSAPDFKEWELAFCLKLEEERVK